MDFLEAKSTTIMDNNNNFNKIIQTDQSGSIKTDRSGSITMMTDQSSSIKTNNTRSYSVFFD